MKLVIAIIRPHKLPDVKAKLAEIGVLGMTVTNVLGSGTQKSFVETFRGAVEEIDLHKKVRIEIAVSAERVEDVINALCKGAYTGQKGDGKIFILNLEEAIRIRTGERGKDAV